MSFGTRGFESHPRRHVRGLIQNPFKLGIIIFNITFGSREN